MSNVRSRPAYCTFLTHSPQPLDVEQSDLFFRVEHTDEDTSAGLTASPIDLSLRTPCSSGTGFDADSDYGDAASIDTPTLIRNSEGRVGYERYETSEVSSAGTSDSERLTGFQERRLHSDIFFNCTVDGIMYPQTEESPEQGSSAEGRMDGDSQNSPRDVLGPFVPEMSPHGPARVVRGERDTAVLDPDRTNAAWFVPQPANMERVRKTPFYILEANAANRIAQDLQLTEINCYLDPVISSRGMHGYYAHKYGPAAAKDPFVRKWLRATVAEINTSTARKEEDLTGNGEQMCAVSVDERTYGDDDRLLSPERDHPSKALGHDQVGEVIVENAPSLLFDPDNRISGESSRATPIAALQSVRRGRPLPKLSLETGPGFGETRRK
ncbi:MAG: hypothetical protein Q9165_006907 [Trypethelium subeluteriae]